MRRAIIALMEFRAVSLLRVRAENGKPIPNGYENCFFIFHFDVSVSRVISIPAGPRVFMR